MSVQVRHTVLAQYVEADGMNSVSRRHKRFIGLLICAFVVLLANASTSGAVTVTGASTMFAAGAMGTIHIDAGNNARECELVARSGHNRLGPLRYKISEPIVVITGRVPSKARSLTRPTRRPNPTNTPAQPDPTE